MPISRSSSKQVAEPGVGLDLFAPRACAPPKAGNITVIIRLCCKTQGGIHACFGQQMTVKSWLHRGYYDANNTKP